MSIPFIGYFTGSTYGGVEKKDLYAKTAATTRIAKTPMNITANKKSLVRWEILICLNLLEPFLYANIHTPDFLNKNKSP